MPKTLRRISSLGEICRYLLLKTSWLKSHKQAVSKLIHSAAWKMINNLGFE